MKRNLLLGLMTAFGALAVGVLLVLSGGGEGGVRSDVKDEGTRQIGLPAPAPVTRRGQTVTAEQARGPVRVAPTAVVQPGLREPFDSEETILAREQAASRIEELVRGMINPELKPDERMALARELQRLIRQLGNRVSPAVRTKLLEMLATAAPSWKDAVVGAIGSLTGDVETAGALLEMLKSTPDDVHTRRAIYSALGQMNVREVTPALMEMLGEGLADEPLIIRTIGTLANPEQLEDLFARLDAPLVAASRTEIEKVLQDRGRIPGFFDKVAGALDEADPQKRRSLLRILSASNEPAHAQKVREILKSEADPESRAIAIQALGRFGDVDSGKMLLDLVQTGSEQDQGRAIQAIHAIHDRDTIGILATGYGNLEREGRVAVMGSISRLPAPSDDMFKLASEHGLVDEDLRVRTSAARVLGKRGRDEGVDALVAFLERSTHPAEKSAALSALETIHTRKAADAATRALGAVPNGRQRDRWQERFRQIADETTEK